MALTVRLLTTVNQIRAGGQVRDTFFARFKSENLGFEDRYTGVKLTPDDPISDDLTSMITETLDDGVTPKLINIGQGILNGVLEVYEGSFPGNVFASPVMALYAMGGLTLIPGVGTDEGKTFKLEYSSTSGIIATEWSVSGVDELPKAPQFIWPKGGPITRFLPQNV